MFTLFDIVNFVGENQYARLAQLVEQLALNQRVKSSNLLSRTRICITQITTYNVDIVFIVRYDITYKFLICRDSSVGRALPL